MIKSNFSTKESEKLSLESKSFIKYMELAE